MRRVLLLSVCLAAPMVSIADGPAWARPKGQVSAGSNAIPLPSNLTSNKDWLDDGAGDPASGTLRPNAENNDNYYLEQVNGYDPTWYTETGSILDWR
jgi:hypothetical protein